MDAAASAPAPAASAVQAAPAVQQLPPGWRVLHCGVARGVLWVTYVAEGRAAITPAVPNARIAEACAAAGHPLLAGAVQRTPPAAAARQSSSLPPPRLPAVRTPPSFTPQALGALLAIDARNDGDATWRCSIDFSWAGDASATAVPQAYSGQVTLAPRQAARVAQVTTGSASARFVGTPRWFCNALE